MQGFHRGKNQPLVQYAGISPGENQPLVQHAGISRGKNQPLVQHEGFHRGNTQNTTGGYIRSLSRGYLCSSVGTIQGIVAELL